MIFLKKYTGITKRYGKKRKGSVPESCIAFGTPLPKGHGDLIDRNGLLNCSYKIDSRYCEYDEVVKVDDIKDAPTILEADKEETNG